MSLNKSTVLKILGYLLGIAGIAMLPSFFVSLYLGEKGSALGFGLTAASMICLSASLLWFLKGVIPEPRLREGMFIVFLGWFFASFAGAFPYLISGTLQSFPDAFFESVSGFTTTGATVFSDIEALPRGILLWRSMCQWLGGMGILVFVISILPSLGINGHNILNAESPGPGFQNPETGFKGSAKKLYLVYVAMTVIEIILLLLGGMNLFDSVIFCFGSISSSGLTSYNDGIMHFDSIYIEAVIAVFMLLSCVNFSLYYYIVKRKFEKFWNNTEFRVFIGIMAVSAVMVCLNLRWSGTYNTADSIRYGVFQTVSFMTTTGNASTDFMHWPGFSQMLLTTLTFIGGSSSSTGGAIKVIRVIILGKLVWRSLSMRVHPNAVIGIKLEGKPLPSNTVNAAVAFFLTYIAVFLAGAFVISFGTEDFQTAFVASSALLSNTGTGFGTMGIFGNYSAFAGPMKLFMSFMMLAGRLEIYTVLLIGSRVFWNPHK